jgi:iron(III) transport system ATP-binding protein
LYVTHDQTEAMTLSDRIAVVNRGRFEQVGTPEEVYEQPASSFAGEFLGRTVILTATIAKNHSGVWLDFADGGRIAVESVPADTLSDGTYVRISTRPEDVEILPMAEPASNQIGGRIEQIDYLGDRFDYHVRAAGALLVLSAAKKQRYSVGSQVRLSFDPSRLNIHPR